MDPTVLNKISRAFTDSLIGRTQKEDYYRFLAESAADYARANKEFPGEFCEHWLARAMYNQEILNSSEYVVSKLVHRGFSHYNRLRIIFWNYAFGTTANVLLRYLEKYESGNASALEKLTQLAGRISPSELACATIKLSFSRRDQPGNFQAYFSELVRGNEV